MAKDALTRAEYLQFLGLVAMARQHTRKVNDIRDAMYELLGTSDEDDKRGWISDLIWAPDQTSAEMALKGLEITVEGGEDANT